MANITIAAYGQLEKFGPLVIGCVPRTAGCLILIRNHADPLTSLKLLNLLPHPGLEQYKAQKV